MKNIFSILIIFSFINCAGGGSSDNNNNTANPFCGDSIINGTETCDATDFGGIDCTNLGKGFSGGTLICNLNCDGYIETACTTPSETCGDDTIDGSDVCDGTDLGVANCTTMGLGFTGGTLYCNDNCDGFITTLCTSDGTEYCGNNIKDGGDVCDGTDLGTGTCQNQGDYSGGTLTCNPSCTGFITTQCIPNSTNQIDLSGYYIELWRNTSGGTMSLDHTYNFSGMYDKGSYLLFVRNLETLVEWASSTCFIPAIEASGTALIKTYTDTNSWLMNGTDDDLVRIYNPSAVLKDEKIVPLDSIITRNADGTWATATSTVGAIGAPNSVTGVETSPIYIYQIGERGDITNQMQHFNCNYTLIYIKE
jgi:hypothetical protein